MGASTEPLPTLDASRCALVLVDYQARLMPSIHDAENVVEHAVVLGRIAHALGVPVFGTEENPRGLGPNHERIRALCHATLAKTCFDACADGLLDALRHGGRRVEQVAVAGCEAHVCLLQTSLGLQRAGLAVFVVPMRAAAAGRATRRWRCSASRKTARYSSVRKWSRSSGCARARIPNSGTCSNW
jgi:nicotinamidase-related amidase